MRLPLGFTDGQLKIWGMRRNGIPKAEIARRLGVTRQAIHKAVRGIDDKVSQTLRATALAAKIEVSYIDPVKGILLGYSHEAGDQVIVTFSARHGAQIWHRNTGRCDECKLHKTCREVTLDEAEERGVALTKEEKNGVPAEIASLVFSRVIPRLDP